MSAWMPRDVATGGLHFGGRFLHGIAFQPGNYDPGPGPGETVGDHAAQPAGAARHENDLVFPITHGRYDTKKRAEAEPANCKG